WGSRGRLLALPRSPLTCCENESSPFRFRNGDICRAFSCARSVRRLETDEAHPAPVDGQRVFGPFAGVRPVSGPRPDSLGRSHIPPHDAERAGDPWASGHGALASAGVDVDDHPESPDYPSTRRRVRHVGDATLTTQFETPSRRFRRVAGARTRDGY